MSKHFSLRKRLNSLVLRLGRLIWTQDAVSLLKQLAARLLLIKSPCLWIEVIAHIPSSLSWRSKMDGGWPKMKVNLSPCTSQSVYKAWKRSDRTLEKKEAMATKMTRTGCVLWKFLLWYTTSNMYLEVCINYFKVSCSYLLRQLTTSYIAKANLISF